MKQKEIIKFATSGRVNLRLKLPEWKTAFFGKHAEYNFYLVELPCLNKVQLFNVIFMFSDEFMSQSMATSNANWHNFSRTQQSSFIIHHSENKNFTRKFASITVQ